MAWEFSGGDTEKANTAQEVTGSAPNWKPMSPNCTQKSEIK